MNLRGYGINPLAYQSGIIRGSIVFGKIMKLENQWSLAGRNELNEPRKENAFSQSRIVDVPEVGRGTEVLFTGC